MSEHIWPEIPKGIREVRIVDMQIYLTGGGICVEIPAVSLRMQTCSAALNSTATLFSYDIV